MSTAARYERPGALERLTDSTAFAVLFGLASVVLAPVVLLGLLVLPSMLLGAADLQLTDRLAVMLPYGGLVGYIGLFRARRPSTSAPDLFATLGCLGVGIATAATLIGSLVAVGVGVDWFAAGAIVVLSLPIVAAVGRIARLRRLRRAAEARVLDSLPLIFLAMAIGEALCAIAIGVRLALGG